MLHLFNFLNYIQDVPKRNKNRRSQRCKGGAFYFKKPKRIRTKFYQKWEPT